MTILQLLTACLLLYMAYQDFRYRGIYWWLYPLVALFVAAHAFLTQPFELMISWLGASMAYVITLSVLIALYLRIRFKGWVNPFKGYFGIGDFLFWIAVLPAFSTMWFMTFQAVSLTGALAIHVWLRNRPFYGPKQQVPLAGLQAVLFVAFQGFSTLMPEAIFYDDFVLLSIFS